MQGKDQPMPTRAIHAACALLGLLCLVLTPGPVQAYIDAPHSLGMVVNLSTNIIDASFNALHDAITWKLFRAGADPTVLTN